MVNTTFFDASLSSPVQENLVPPHSNTGEPATALIDALTFTFGELVSVEDVKNLPAFRGMAWLPMEKGDLGYKSGWFCNGVCILHDGTPGMGTHVRMMGQACRWLEGRAEFSGWVEFLRSILRYKLPVMLPQLGEETGRETSLYYSAKISRLDGAMDDGTGLLNMGRIRQAISDCSISSTYRSWRELADGDIKTGAISGNTIYFGRRDGDSLMRFYNRGAKMGLSETLIRCELELHDEQARAFCEALLGGAEFGQLLAGIIRRKLDFKEGQRPETSNGRNYAKWETADWWDAFLGGVEKMKLGIAPVVRTLQKGKAWIMRQVAPLFSTLLDLGEVQFISDIIEEGRKRRPEWQKALLESVGVPLFAPV